MPLIIALIMSAAVGWGLQMVISGTNIGLRTSPVARGRSWAGWAVFFVTLAAFTNFLLLLEIEPFAVWLVNVIAWGVFAFGAGCLYGKLFGKKELPGTEGVPAQKESMNFEKTANAPPINPTSYQDTSTRAVAQKSIPIATKEQAGSRPDSPVSANEGDYQVDQKMEDEFYETAWAEVEDAR